MKDQRIELGLVLIIVLIGAFFRLVFFRDHLMFQGDQGRDAIIAKQILKDHDLALVGPVTSVGNMYLGPFYYYFMVPWLALTFPDPIGPAYGVAITSILSLFLLYRLARMILPVRSALFSLAIMTFSSIGIIYSRFSWNPNLAPAVSVLLLWCLIKTGLNQRHGYWLGVALTFAILIQLHYVTLLVAPVLLMVFIYQLITLRTKRKNLLLWGLLASVIFLLSFTPLIIFNFRHHQLISNSFINFFTSNEEHLKPLTKLGAVMTQVGKNLNLVFNHLVGIPNSPLLNRVMLIGGLAIFGWQLRSKSRLHKQVRIGLMILLGFLVTAGFGISFYTSSIFDHYLLYLLPILALFYGVIFESIMSLGKGFTVVAVMLLGMYLWINLTQLPFMTRARPSIDRDRQVVADTLIKLPPGKFNIVSLTTTKDYKGMNYRYFYEVSEKKPESVENYDLIDYLVIIDELGIQDPLTAAIYEIQASGPNKVLENQIVSADGIKVSIYHINRNAS